MYKYVWLFLLSILIYAIHGLAQPKLPEVPRIDAKMAYLKYKPGRVILVDAMGPKTFAKKHILGSMSLPNDDSADIERIRDMEIPFPKDKEIIVYCEWAGEDASAGVALELIKKGFKKNIRGKRRLEGDVKRRISLGSRGKGSMAKKVHAEKSDVNDY